ncbi:hypothetical protein [Ornithinibacillus xuwenensis]|uniref:Pilus assembly protein PilO n=1 Tax=Ornithinibacillus xuwenensis TaxID=3144668 RepID=A0ABU9XBD0_9BACI
MSRSWSKKHFLIAIGILILSILLYFGLYISIVKPLQTKENLLIQKVSTHEAIYERISKEKESTQGQREPFEIIEMIPNEKSPDLVIERLYQLGNQANVRISYIGALEQSEPSDTIGKAPYSLELESENLYDMNIFLNTLLESKRLMTVDSLDISQSEESIFASVTFTTFYQINE